MIHEECAVRLFVSTGKKPVAAATKFIARTYLYYMKMTPIKVSSG